MNIIKSFLKLLKSIFAPRPEKSCHYSYNTDKNINTTIQLDPVLKKAEGQKLPKDLSEKQVITTISSEPIIEVKDQLVKKKGRKPSNKKK